MSRNWKLPRQGDTEFSTLITNAAATRTNICLQSEDLSTSWTNVQSVDTQAQGTAPDGTNTANKLTDDGGGTGPQGALIAQTFTTVVATAYTMSCYFKADQLDWGYLTFANSGALTISAYFDLTNGVVGATTGSDNTSESITDVGDGWYRCSIVFTSDAADTVGDFQIYLAEANGDVIVPDDGTSSIFIWGAHLEASATPTQYTSTTSVARAITAMTATGNYMDDVHTALETVLETTGSIDDLWQKYKRLN